MDDDKVKSAEPPSTKSSRHEVAASRLYSSQPFIKSVQPSRYCCTRGFAGLPYHTTMPDFDFEHTLTVMIIRCGDLRSRISWG